MKQYIFIIILLFLAEITLHRCANPMSPSGGPKDTIPPTLLLSTPLDQTLNFDGNEIVLYFDEFIGADKLKQNLIITPNSDIKYKSTIKKRDLRLKFENRFEDSTTYTLNFFDGVTDITERNPVPNLIIAFSTGDYIDSLSIRGSVSELMTDKKLAKATVGIYPISDSLDIFTSKPYYFVTTTENGQFEIQNIKAGKYRIASFLDENKNMKLDDATESYGFLSDTLNIAAVQDSIRLYQIKVDASILKFISARPSGKYFEARYNKIVTRHNIQSLDSNQIVLPTSITPDGDAIRFYRPNPYQIEQEYQYILTVTDSLKNQAIDTVNVSFTNTARKYADFTSTFATNKSQQLSSDYEYKVDFNKPIISNSLDTINYQLDSLIIFTILAQNITWNDHKTQVRFKLNFTPQNYQDTIESLIAIYKPDSLNNDSIKAMRHKFFNNIDQSKIQFSIPKAAFISADFDTTKVISQIFRLSDNREKGTITINLETSEKSYFVQLMNDKNEIQSQLYNCSQCTFRETPPGEYSLRILIDEDNNGKWDIGNIRQSREPEKIIFFKEKSALRANWEIELEYSF